jgi:O-antigen/teichoic acid export membrane protein
MISWASSIPFFHKKLSRDIAFTLISFVILALSGIVINVLIISYRDAASLGIFNLSYAVYIVASQIATFGVHYSVLRHTAHFQEDLDELDKLLFGAIVCSLTMGGVMAALLILSRPLYADYLKNYQTSLAISFAAYGLILFPLNKVMLAYLNGLRHMKAFSFLQAVRYIVVMLVVGIFVVGGYPIALSALSFIFAEAFTATLALFYISKYKLLRNRTLSLSWIKKHLSFGRSSLMAGIFSEFNSRIDVLLIGFLLTEKSVGIYSFAAMLADGLYQVLSVVRTNINPILVSAIRDRSWGQITDIRLKTGQILSPSIMAISIFLCGIYFVFSFLLFPDKGLQQGMPSLLIMLSGLTLISFLVPFDNLMLVIGRPGLQSLQQMVALLFNMISSLVLLPVIGIEGAAIGTVLSYISGVFMMMFFAKRIIGWRIFANRFEA